MIDKSPESRISIEQVIQHPIISRLKGLLDESLAIGERRYAAIEAGHHLEEEEAEPMLGGVVEERETFLREVFEIVHNYGEESSVVEDGDDEMEVDI